MLFFGEIFVIPPKLENEKAGMFTTNKQAFGIDGTVKQVTQYFLLLPDIRKEARHQINLATVKQERFLTFSLRSLQATMYSINQLHKQWIHILHNAVNFVLLKAVSFSMRYLVLVLTQSQHLALERSLLDIIPTSFLSLTMSNF